MPDFIGLGESVEALETRMIVNALTERISTRNILFNLNRPKHVGEALRQVYKLDNSYKKIKTFTDVFQNIAGNAERLNSMLRNDDIYEDIFELESTEFNDMFDMTYESAKGLILAANHSNVPIKKYGEQFLTHFNVRLLTLADATKLYQPAKGIDYIIAYCVGAGGNCLKINFGQRAGNGGNLGGLGGINGGTYASATGGSGGLWIQIFSVKPSDLIRYTIGEPRLTTTETATPESVTGGDSFMGENVDTYPYITYPGALDFDFYLPAGLEWTNNTVSPNLNGANYNSGGAVARANAIKYKGVVYGQGANSCYREAITNDAQPGCIILFEHKARV